MTRARRAANLVEFPPGYTDLRWQMLVAGIGGPAVGNLVGKLPVAPHREMQNGDWRCAFNARLCRNAAGCARWAFVVLN
jgi:hypothetical protein